MTPTVADLASPYVHSLLEEVEELREEVRELKRLIFGQKKGIYPAWYRYKEANVHTPNVI